MKQRSGNAVTLRTLVQSHRVPSKGLIHIPQGERFISDEHQSLRLSDLISTSNEAAAIEALRGKSVMLAMPSQMAAAWAMVALDGVVRRMLLWPEVIPQDAMPAIMHAASIDTVLSQWPPAPAAPAHARADRRPRAAAAMNTEWVLMTSGTSGRPKLVVHTLETLSGHLWDLPRVYETPVWSTFYDIRRYGGLQVLLRALAGGGSLVLSSPTEPPADFLARAGAAHVRYILGTPSHWRRALLTGRAGLIDPVYVRLSGEIADQAILDRLRDTYPHAAIVHAFASTEAGLVFEVADGIAGFSADLLAPRPNGHTTRVHENTLQVRSARNALGYLDGTLRPIPGTDGFVDTGDIVRQTGERYHYVGRRDGVVNVGGDKVHPEEIESVVNQHPDVQMSRAHARRNPITGAVVVADIVRKPQTADGANIPLRATRELEMDIIAFCRSRLSPHKVPASVRIVDSIDVTVSGKLTRTFA